MDDLDRRFTEAEKACETRINAFAEKLQTQIAVLEVQIITLTLLLRDTASANSHIQENLRQELDRAFKIQPTSDTEDEEGGC